MRNMGNKLAVKLKPDFMTHTQQMQGKNLMSQKFWKNRKKKTHRGLSFSPLTLIKVEGGGGTPTSTSSTSLFRRSHESLPFFPTNSRRGCCCGQVWFEWQITLMQTQQLMWSKRSCSLRSLLASWGLGHRKNYPCAVSLHTNPCHR